MRTKTIEKTRALRVNEKPIAERVNRLAVEINAVKKLVGTQNSAFAKEVGGVRLRKRDDERKWAKQYMMAKANYKPVTFSQAIDQEIANKKIAVRLDHRTVIFITPGTDIRAISNHINQQHISI